MQLLAVGEFNITPEWEVIMRIVNLSGVRTLIAVAGLLLVTAAAAPAQVLFSNLGPGDSFDSSVGWILSSSASACGIDQQIATSFVPSSTASLGTVELALDLFGGGANEIDIAVMTDAAGVPGATLESIHLSGAIPGSPALVTATSALNPVLTGGTTYWVAALVGLDTCGAWWFNNTGDLDIAGSFDSGASWSGFPGLTAGALRVSGTAVVPEPTTLGLLGALVIATPLALRRRRMK